MWLRNKKSISPNPLPSQQDYVMRQGFERQLMTRSLPSLSPSTTTKSSTFLTFCMMVAFSKSTGPCSDAGRITTKLLFSLLALLPLSAVVAASDPLPPTAAAHIHPGDVLGPGPVLGGGEAPKGPGAGGERSDLVFVGAPWPPGSLPELGTTNLPS